MCWCGVEIEGEGRRTEDGGRRQASIEEEGDDDDGIMDLKKNTQPIDGRLSVHMHR